MFGRGCVRTILFRFYETEALASVCVARWPVTTGALESFLVSVRNTFSERRASCRNMRRVEHYVILAQLRQRGVANAQNWALELRKHHLAVAGGKPPKRRAVDKNNDSTPPPAPAQAPLLLTPTVAGILGTQRLNLQPLH